MVSQIVAFGVGLVAMLAFIHLTFAEVWHIVHPHVFLQVALLNELCTTLLTAVRHDSKMHFNMVD